MVSRPCLTPLVLMSASRFFVRSRPSAYHQHSSSYRDQIGTCKVERMDLWKSCWRSVSFSLSIRTWWLYTRVTYPLRSRPATPSLLHSSSRMSAQPNGVAKILNY